MVRGRPTICYQVTVVFGDFIYLDFILAKILNEKHGDNVHSTTASQRMDLRKGISVEDVALTTTLLD
jgi:hypothetical protein